MQRPAVSGGGPTYAMKRLEGRPVLEDRAGPAKISNAASSGRRGPKHGQSRVTIQGRWNQGRPACTSRRQAKAAAVGRRFEGRPPAPEHERVSVGVGILTKGPLALMPLLKNYADAVASGSCCIYTLDLGGTTLLIANIYGWAAGKRVCLLQAGRTISWPSSKQYLKPNRRGPS